MITPEGKATLPDLYIEFNEIKLDPENRTITLLKDGVPMSVKRFPPYIAGDVYVLSGFEGRARVDLSWG